MRQFPQGLFVYLRVLAVFYFIGAVLHLADVLDLRLPFSEMSLVWKCWILFLLFADSIAAVGLWRTRSWGAWGFLVVAASQLVAYGFFSGFFGPQTELVLFHVVTLAVFFALGGRTLLRLRAARRVEWHAIDRNAGSAARRDLEDS